MALFTYKATVCFSGMDAKKHPSGPVKGEVASPIAEDDRLSTRQLSPLPASWAVRATNASADPL